MAATFCSLSVPTATEKKLKKMRMRLGAGEISKLPNSMVPEEFRKTGRLTTGMLLEIGMRAIEEQLGRKGS